ncbi:MAG: ATP-binding protein [Candidatus Ancaeobacter aquaticus]|nr:ATP-binding protein [Candidatus Ancaeobacter aquaticus]
MIRKTNKLEKKVIVFFLICVLFSIGITAYVAIDVSVRMLKDATYESLKMNAKLVAFDVKRELVVRLDSLKNFTKAQVLLSSSNEQIRERLYHFLALNPSIATAQLLDNKGVEIAEITRANRLVSKGKKYSDANRFVIAHVNGTYISPVYVNEDGKRSILLSSRIGENISQCSGVVVIEMSLAHFTRLIEEENTLKRIVYIVDNRGDIVAYPNYSWVKAKKNLSEIPSVKDVISELKEHPQKYYQYKSPEGIVVFGVYERLPYLGWGVIVEEPYVFVFMPIYKMIHRIGFISVIVSVLIIGLGVLIVRRKIKPLIVLHDSAQKIKEGNLDIQIDTHTGDEIEDLAHAFNLMTKRLKEMYEDLEAKISERTAQLKVAQDKLIYSEKLTTIGKLASIVGHELRNPLAIIRNSVYYLNMFDIGKVNEEAKEQLDIIEKEVDDATQIISQILDFAREKEPKLTNANIHKLIKEILDGIELPSNIVSKVRFCSADSTLSIDPLLMGRVFQNIITNAIQSMPLVSGKIVVSTEKTDSALRVIIKDTGSGISEESLGKIFDPLYSTKARGTGLGLTFCKSIVERHGGVIAVDSVVNEGTTFNIELPLPNVTSS